MTLHPYLATAGDPFTAVVRACYWQVVDSNPLHADYWREQVRFTVTEMEGQSVGGEGVPERVKESRRVLIRDQVRRAMTLGWNRGAYRTDPSVPVPEFESGSVCNTRTLCTGVHS